MSNNNIYSLPLEDQEPVTSSNPSRDSFDIDFADYLLKVKRRWKPALAVFLLTLGATAVLSLLLEKTYPAQGKLLFKSESAASLTGVATESGKLTNLLQTQTPLNNELEKLTTSSVLQQTIDKLQLKDEEGNPIKPEDLRQKLDIGLVPGSDIIQIGYEDRDPKVAAEIVNSLMNVYVGEQVRGNQSEPAVAREFINKQLPQIETRVFNAESELAKFRTENSIIDLQQEKKIIVGELGAINRQIAEVGSQYQGKQAQTSALQGQIGLNLPQAIAADQLGSTPIVQSILDGLAETETQLSQEKQRFKDNHPAVVSLQEKKNNLNQQLQQIIAQTVGQGVKVSEGLLRRDQYRENSLEKFIALKIEELSLQRQYTSLAQSQQVYLQRANALPKLEKREQELLREFETADKTYKTLLDSLQEVQLAENQTSGNVEIIEPAITPEKGSSGRTAFLLLGAVSGFLLSNLAVVLLEMQDRTLKTVPEIKKKLPYKVLGIIPFNNYATSNHEVSVYQDPDSYISEIYRMIQANLKFMTSQIPPKVILVTSSVPGEGKSTVTANLAAAIAQLGRRVLLIDGDLRKPSQHYLWELGNTLGLKEILREEKALDMTVSRPMPNLDILASGKVMSNPLALLDSSEMSQLVAQTRKDYDLVFIDAPPLPVTADILTLAKLADGIVFVTRPGVVEQESAELAQEILLAMRNKVLGMVINGVNVQEFERYAYTSRSKSNTGGKLALIKKDNNEKVNNFS